MTDRTLTRQSFLLQLSCGLTAFAVGCDSDDSDGDSTDTDATTDATGSSTAPGTTSGDPGTTSSGSTDPTETTTSGDPSTSSSGGGETGSSSGEGSSSGSSSGGEASVCVEGVVAAAISNNHGHTVEIPLADIEAGVETTYDTGGPSGHCHRVVLTAEDFATLRAGGAVTKFSCNGGDHEFVLSCSEGARPPADPARECAGEPNAGSC